MYVYASLYDFVCIALLLPFVLGFCMSFFFVFCIVFSGCYHWWICLLVWLLPSFFLSFLYYFLFIFNNCLIFYFNNFIYYYFLIFSFFLFSPFSSEPCGSQGPGAPAGCQACASEVGEPSSRHWSTRDLQAPLNIKQQKLSQRFPSQR